MIDATSVCQTYRTRILFAGPEGTTSYEDFLKLVEAERGEISLPRSGSTMLMQVPLEWEPGGFARLLAILSAGHSVTLTPECPKLSLAPFEKHAPLVILPTGGTMGQPRHVVHAASRLLGGYRIQKRPPVRLLVLYAAGHIAGLDAFFQAFHRGSTLVIPADRRAATIAACIEQERVEVLPATPTFLQFLLLSGELEGRQLESVTTIPHGAEPMSPKLRERVGEAFPRAQLHQRFGLTELGALPVREDPDDPKALFLDSSGCQWKVEGGELFIKSPARMLGTLEDGPVDPDNAWHATGDLAEMTGRGSVRVLGRREAVINVGGEKVIPETVEALLMDLPNVRDAAVTGLPNPLTGEAVYARIVFDGTPEPMALLRDARRAARARGLSMAHVPTKIEPAATIDRTSIGKRPRGKA
jgi:acyl-coenzyme A synthetase/AMP-(fatty) acid ligase